MVLAQLFGLAHDHIAVIILLPYDPAGLFGIASHHGGVHLLGITSLLQPQAHHIGLHASGMAQEILCSHARTPVVEVDWAVQAEPN